jgi:pimeloyl-ACP methyl ester carboxylesterase
MKQSLRSIFCTTILFFLCMMYAHAQVTPPPDPDEIEQPADYLIDDSKPTFVIVHGAWGGSWAFREVEMRLREKGYDVYRPSLTGLGERYHLANEEINLSTHLDDVVNAILFEELENIVLVGHSYGGMVISGVAHRIPDRIQSMIFVDAFVPNDGESIQSIQGDDFEKMMEMEEGGFLIPRWVPAEQPPPRDVPHPLNAFTEPVVLGNEDAYNIPAIYIHAVEEGTEPIDDGFYIHAERAGERGWPVLIIESDHNPQWSAPEKLVEMLHQNW